MADYRKPTEQETAKLDKSRELMTRGIKDEKGMLSRIMPTMAKAARDDMRAAKSMRESVSPAAREYEAYNDAGYKKGGKVKKYADGGNVEPTSGTPPLSAEQLDKNRRMLEKAQREADRMPPQADKDTKAEFDKRVADGEDYSYKTLSESVQSAQAPYKIKNMRDDARKNTSDILRRPIGMKKGGSVSSASKRADGCAVKGKTKGMMR